MFSNGTKMMFLYLSFLYYVTFIVAFTCPYWKSYSFAWLVNVYLPTCPNQRLLAQLPARDRAQFAQIGRHPPACPACYLPTCSIRKSLTCPVRILVSCTCTQNTCTFIFITVFLLYIYCICLQFRSS